ncbi:HAD-IIA family hydrolase [Billgrantia montanilacus]|uniref:Haloacid dehalogenase n=1 Tax=Billgrantia montanilacus TaxID=2282305 RepID=A0A368TTN0_9GAMM|nr:HAD family hydrolase [Halomonas montanilacus]RCV87990.1 haloacid dehalogenase [Halomonas montanilacus]
MQANVSPSAADTPPSQHPDVTDPRWQAILCDLDGCLISGELPLPGTQALFQRLGDRLWIVSNNSTDTPASLGARLRGMGLAIADERLILAGVEAIDDLARHKPGSRVALFASQALVAHAESQGLKITQRCPQTVLLCRDTGFDYAALRRIIGYLEGGAKLLVANPDVSHPSLDGPPVPETGALLSAICSVLPRQDFRVIGKPERHLFDVALTRAGVHAGQAMMIGDNVMTDGAGAQALDIAFLEVMPNAGLGQILGGASC